MSFRNIEGLLNSPKRPLIMGILNVTPDSFSDGGKFLRLDQALERAFALLDQGADILDIGGVSTRPPGKEYGAGAELVSESEEADRVLPVITGILREIPEAVLSIDTYRASTASLALEAGAEIVNDVSAGTSDPEMFGAVSRHRAPIILMHGYGPHFNRSSIDDYVYADVIRETFEYLELRIRIAREAGIGTVLADVGIGFAKGFHDNLRLMHEHASFEELGVPLVFGASRKSSVGRTLGRQTLPDERVSASVAAAIYAAANGAKIVRVHDVLETRDAFAMLDAIASLFERQSGDA